ncbi:MAG: hypothetical protein IJS49_02940 [Paludibacteraceae bacterium]|nr:hypothetical protein [Paludibacteraceae bacterium]
MTIEEIEDALDDELSRIDGICYEIDSEEEDEGYCFEIEFDYEEFDGTEDDDWDEQVEDAIEEVKGLYGGSYYWEDNVVFYTVSFDD